MKSEGEKVVRVSLAVRGRVQGVGFRYFVRELADEFALTGKVRNLSDGRVYAEAQGRKKDVDQFIAMVRQGPPLASVHDIDICEIGPQSFDSGFVVEY